MTPPALDASVILITFNQLDSTRLALSALFAQDTRRSYEVIVCDDGSDPSATGALLAAMRDAPIPVYLAHQQDRGFRLAANRNNGIKMSRGRILIFLDGDMVPEEDFVERHVETHTHDRVIGVGTRFWRSPDVVYSALEDGEPLWAILRSEAAQTDETRYREIAEQFYRRLLAKGQPWMDCYGCNISVTRSERIGFDESFQEWGNEDYEMFYCLYSQHGYEVTSTPAVAYELEGKPRDWTQANYISHLCSGFRFYDKWAHAGLRPEFALPLYHLDPETNTWGDTRLPTHGYASGYTDDYVNTARAWLEERGYYRRETDAAEA